MHSYIAAIAYDAGGGPLAEVHLAGADAYDFTARFLAWAARRAAADGVAVTGAAGPLQAFGAHGARARLQGGRPRARGRDLAAQRDRPLRRRAGWPKSRICTVRVSLTLRTERRPASRRATPPTA